MAAVLGDRQAAVARELTKLHEEVRRGALGELAAHYEAAGAPKGELVVVVGPPAAAEAGAGFDLDDALRAADRKSVAQGKRGAVRVDLGGRRIIKKKITKLSSDTCI